jgi:hypothetical protein
MNSSTIAVLTAMLCAAAATPALADWDKIGTITVSGGREMDRDSRNFRLGGPVERLQLTADRSNIDCRSIRADFGNGEEKEIFQGRLRRGRPTSVDLPGNARTLTGLKFQCSATGRRDGTIRILADVGQFRDQWRRGPDWQNKWSNLFRWDNGHAGNRGNEQAYNQGNGRMQNQGNQQDDWQMIGSESFEGTGDSEKTNADWRGRRVDSVALRPLEADARCSRVTGKFANGKTQALNLDQGDVLRRGQFTKVDLPGNVRDLDSLNLRCSAVNAGRVTIQIFVSK